MKKGSIVKLIDKWPACDLNNGAIGVIGAGKTGLEDTYQCFFRGSLYFVRIGEVKILSDSEVTKLEKVLWGLNEA